MLMIWQYKEAMKHVIFANILFSTPSLKVFAVFWGQYLVIQIFVNIGTIDIEVIISFTSERIWKLEGVFKETSFV